MNRMGVQNLQERGGQFEAVLNSPIKPRISDVFERKKSFQIQIHELRNFWKVPSSRFKTMAMVVIESQNFEFWEPRFMKVFEKINYFPSISRNPFTFFKLSLSDPLNPLNFA